MISVIIVNYNVKKLLKECLASVYHSLLGMEAEVFVVDNNSTDGSVEYLMPLFPQATFIRNSVNVGFGKANNQALLQAKGKYILFLNPDTVVPQDCFSSCVSLMNDNAKIGALGVRMVDGEGMYLKESKRAFPAPLTSFWKMTGVTAMFPRSRVFAKYYLGDLDEFTPQQIEVISGAFMLTRKEVLDKTGGFDERFFMYAEDIDLSYRIIRSGYINYYYPDVTIVHYKGSSTKKDFKYVRQFYLAMSQFVKKYYGRGVFSFLLDGAIWLRAGVEGVKLKIKNITGKN